MSSNLEELDMLHDVGQIGTEMTGGCLSCSNGEHSDTHMSK